MQHAWPDLLGRQAGNLTWETLQLGCWTGLDWTGGSEVTLPHFTSSMLYHIAI